jgi:hypothetical protein
MERNREWPEPSLLFWLLGRCLQVFSLRTQSIRTISPCVNRPARFLSSAYGRRPNRILRRRVRCATHRGTPPIHPTKTIYLERFSMPQPIFMRATGRHATDGLRLITASRRISLRRHILLTAVRTVLCSRRPVSPRVATVSRFCRSIMKLQTDRFSFSSICIFPASGFIRV